MNYFIKPFVIELENKGEDGLKHIINSFIGYKYFTLSPPPPEIGKEKEKGKGKGRGRGRGRGKGKHQEDPKPGTSGETEGYPSSGLGLKFISSDPNALIDRFDLLFSSKKAGHTGVINEIVTILDELKRQKVINVNEYKKLNSLIKK